MAHLSHHTSYRTSTGCDYTVSIHYTHLVDKVDLVDLVEIYSPSGVGYCYRPMLVNKVPW